MKAHIARLDGIIKRVFSGSRIATWPKQIIWLYIIDIALAILVLYTIIYFEEYAFHTIFVYSAINTIKFLRRIGSIEIYTFGNFCCTVYCVIFLISGLDFKHFFRFSSFILTSQLLLQTAPFVIYLLGARDLSYFIRSNILYMFVLLISFSLPSIGMLSIFFPTLLFFGIIHCLFKLSNEQADKLKAISGLFIFLEMIIISLMIVVLFADLYTELGVKTGSSTTSHAFEDALYLSILTWTTVGYGDVTPIGMGKIAAGIEAIMGMITMTILVVGLSETIKIVKRRE